MLICSDEIPVRKAFFIIKKDQQNTDEEEKQDKENPAHESGVRQTSEEDYTT